MNFCKGFLFGIALTVLTAVGISACSKQVDPIVTQPAVQAVVATPVVPAPKVADTPAPVTPASTEPTPTVTPTPAVATKPAQKSKRDSESAAYAKARYNAALASCLRTVVDAKLDHDVKVGSYRDLGNVINSGVCQAKAKAAHKTHKHSKAKAKKPAAKAQ